MTIAPRYDQYKDAWDTNVTVEVNRFFIFMKMVIICCGEETK